MSVKRVYFVRHGEAEGNVNGFTQLPSTPLTKVGLTQAEQVAVRFRQIPVEAVLASYMDRAQSTAAPIAKIVGLPVVTVEQFHERMMPSSIRGLSHESEEYKSYLESERNNYHDKNWRQEDGENFTDLLERAKAGVEMLEQRVENHIIVVTHGRFLRFLTSYLLHKKKLTPEIELLTSTSMVMSNTGVTLFEFNEDNWKLITWNDTAHFAE